MSVSATIFKGVKWTGLSSFSGVLFQLVQTSILARILSTSDFGVMGLALVVISFSQLFLDAGFSAIIIQKKDISQQQLSSLFWLSALLGTLLFLLLMLIAPAIAAFYKEPALIPVIRIISAGFLLIPIESLYLSLIQKNLNFKEIAQRDLLSRTIAFLAGIWAAYEGWGVYSLVLLHMAGILISCLFIFRLGGKYFKPSFFFNLRSIRPFFSFGLFVLGDNLINFINRQIDVLMVGNYLGIQSLGIYNQGKNLTMRPYMVINPILTQINFPLLSKYKEDVPLMKSIYLNTLRYLSLVNFPIYLFLSVFAEEIVLVLFGEKWVAAIPVLQILSLSILLRSIFNPMGGLLMANGKPKWAFFWNLIILLFTPFLLLWAMPKGLFWVCLVQFLFGLVLILPHVRFLIGPLLNINLKEYLTPMLPSLLYSGIACASWILMLPFKELDVFSRFLMAGILFFGIYSLMLLLFSRNLFKELISAVKNRPTV